MKKQRNTDQWWYLSNNPYHLAVRGCISSNRLDFWHLNAPTQDVTSLPDILATPQDCYLIVESTNQSEPTAPTCRLDVLVEAVVVVAVWQWRSRRRKKTRSMWNYWNRPTNFHHRPPRLHVVVVAAVVVAASEACHVYKGDKKGFK